MLKDSAGGATRLVWTRRSTRRTRARLSLCDGVERRAACDVSVYTDRNAPQGACDYDRTEQRFVWDGRTRTLRYARDTTQCVDYFVGLQDFGIWSCFDAGNDEFFRDDARDRYCLLLDHDKCVRGVGASGESVLLRVPGSASCLQLDDPLRPLVSHTCDEQRTAQRWKFDPPLNAFRAAGQPSVCLDYSVDDQAFAVWSCDEQEAENAADDANAGRGFVYHRYSGKYCLRRGRGSTCVMEAEAGSRLLLRRATMRYGCLRHEGVGRRVSAVECDGASLSQQWVFESATATFRHAADASICLDLFSYAGDGMASLPRGAADGAAEEERQLATLDGGGALGSYACRARVPNQRFAYDRYMGRYCVSSQPSVCVLEALPGTPLRLKQPGGVRCLHYDGAMHKLREAACNASDTQQQWAYDTATLVFRHARDSRVCLDYFVAHASFGAWSCRDDLEVNAQQSFRYNENTDRFCLLADPTRCVQEATSGMLY